MALSQFTNAAAHLHCSLDCLVHIWSEFPLGAGFSITQAPRQQTASSKSKSMSPAEMLQECFPTLNAYTNFLISRGINHFNLGWASGVKTMDEKTNCGPVKIKCGLMGKKTGIWVAYAGGIDVGTIQSKKKNMDEKAN